MGRRGYPPEFRRKVLDLVEAGRPVADVARDPGINRETLRTCVGQAEVDAGHRPGTTTEQAQRLAELEREVRELRRANAILKSASAFFAAELDRPHAG